MHLTGNGILILLFIFAMFVCFIISGIAIKNKRGSLHDIHGNKITNAELATLNVMQNLSLK